MPRPAGRAGRVNRDGWRLRRPGAGQRRHCRGISAIPAASPGASRRAAAGQGMDLADATGEDALAGVAVEALGLDVHLHGDLVHDPLQRFADVRREAVPELRVGDHHVVHQAVVGLGEILLHLVDLLALVVRPGVLGAIHHAGLQTLVDLGEGHLPGDRAELAELLVEHVGGLHAEFQPARVFRLQQRAIGGELLHPVVPVGQAEDALALHAGQQGAPLRAALEAVDRLDVVEEERQVEDLHLARVLLELGQGRR